MVAGISVSIAVVMASVSSLSGVILHSGLLLHLLFILFIQSRSTARLKSRHFSHSIAYNLMVII